MAEREYYDIIKKEMEELFKSKNKEVYFEITAKTRFSEKLKGEIRKKGRDILFYFLKGKSANYPDITGFIKETYSTDFVIIEVKDKLELNDLYQARKYGELIDAKFVFLICLKPVPTEIKTLIEKTPTMLSFCTTYRSFVLAQFDKDTSQFVDWFEENPFEKGFYWR